MQPASVLHCQDSLPWLTQHAFPSSFYKSVQRCILVHRSIHPSIHTYIHASIHTCIHWYTHTCLCQCVAYACTRSCQQVGSAGTHRSKSPGNRTSIGTSASYPSTSELMEVSTSIQLHSTLHAKRAYTPNPEIHPANVDQTLHPLPSLMRTIAGEGGRQSPCRSQTCMDLCLHEPFVSSFGCSF